MHPSDVMRLLILSLATSCLGAVVSGQVKNAGFEAGATGEAGRGDMPAAELTGQALNNVVALARLVGAVRYFHPSDEAVATDWLTFTATTDY